MAIAAFDREWHIDPEITFEDWKVAGCKLATTSEALQWHWGEWWHHGHKKWDRQAEEFIKTLPLTRNTLKIYGSVWGVFPKPLIRVNGLSFGHHRIVAPIKNGEERTDWLKQAKKHKWPVLQLKAAIKEAYKPETPELPEGRFRCIIIDPPWPMEKISREVRPIQTEKGTNLDYDQMKLDEIESLPIRDKTCDDGCHIYLWTTHKYLPYSFELFKAWGIKYQCLMTWVKNVGFTPFSWMYSTEHVLFGRIGSLPLLKNGLRLDFNAKVTKHSEKPDIFFDRVRDASPERRLIWFGRKAHEGFVNYGLEAE